MLPNIPNFERFGVVQNNISLVTKIDKVIKSERSLRKPIPSTSSPGNGAATTQRLAWRTSRTTGGALAPYEKVQPRIEHDICNEHCAPMLIDGIYSGQTGSTWKCCQSVSVRMRIPAN